MLHDFIDRAATGPKLTWQTLSHGLTVLLFSMDLLSRWRSPWSWRIVVSPLR
jgi:hypothetical protein